MKLADVTPLIITLNEEPNLERCLAAVAWAARIVIIDSGSSDGTLDIARRFPQVEVFHRPFDSFAAQCNFGMGRVTTMFTLSLDADHVAAPDMAPAVEQLDPAGVAGWRVPFVYCVHGRPLRGSLYPPRVSLHVTAGAYYENDGHAHRVVVPGPVAKLRARIYHDDRKPLGGWFQSQLRYARQEADKLLAAGGGQHSVSDRLRLCLLGPLLVVPYCLFWKGLLLDGWRGLHYTAQRFVAEAILALFLIDARLRKP